MTDKEFIARLVSTIRMSPPLSPDEAERVSRLAQESARARKASGRRKAEETEKP